MKNLPLVTAALACGALVIGCSTSGDDPGGAGGNGTGGARGVGATGGADFAGFTVAPPPGEGDPGNEKQPFEEKLAALLESAEPPSAFAGAFFQLSRAFLSGRAPANDLEEDAFAVLESASTAVHDALTRTLAAIDELDPADRERLYVAKFINAGPEDVLTIEDLANEVTGEVLARVSIQEFGENDPGVCLEAERAGLPRVVQCPGGIEDPAFPGFCPRVCRVKTESLDQPVRTGAFVPRLAPGDYALFETQLECTFNPDVNNSQVCDPVTLPDCRGGFSSEGATSVCLAVPAVRPGETVILYGYNYFDVGATVNLVLEGSAQEPREIDAHVCGDVETPSEATVDCGVGDRMAFQVPGDLPTGLYRVVISVPNNVGDPSYTEPKYESAFSFPDAYIEVVPPASAKFQLAGGELHCIDDTDGEWGRDEIGLITITYSISAADGFSTSEPLKFEFGGVERGDRRPMLSKDTMSRVFFSGEAPAGFGVTIVGHEIDNREAYKKQTSEFAEAFVLILEGAYGKFTGAFGTVAGTLIGVAAASKAAGTAIGAAIAFALNVGFALWAPADLVIEDSINTSFLQLAELTSLNYPNPPAEAKVTQNAIEVVVEPCEDTEELDRPECNAGAKSAGQYTERREYGAERDCPPPMQFGPNCNPDRKGSRYQITFDYTRTE